MNNIDKAKAALEACDGLPVSKHVDMATIATAHALIAIAESLQGTERTCKRTWTGVEMICSACCFSLNNPAARYCPSCGRKVVDE